MLYRPKFHLKFSVLNEVQLTGLYFVATLLFLFSKFSSVDQIRFSLVYLPGLGSIEGEGAAGWVVFGFGLHAAGIAAMVGLRQAKAAQDFSSSCMTNEITRDNLKTVLNH